MVLTDPAGVHADTVGEDRLLADFQHELVRAAGVVRVMVVAEREVTEFHGLRLSSGDVLYWLIANALSIAQYGKEASWNPVG